MEDTTSNLYLASTLRSLTSIKLPSPLAAMKLESRKKSSDEIRGVEKRVGEVPQRGKAHLGCKGGLALQNAVRATGLQHPEQPLFMEGLCGESGGPGTDSSSVQTLEFAVPPRVFVVRHPALSCGMAANVERGSRESDCGTGKNRLVAALTLG
jgi:hypothetical protein